MPSIHRVEPFTALAEVYQAAGMAAYGEFAAPQVLNLLFDLEWTGRSVLDLGCGTGEIALWFSRRSFRAIGVDLSGAMLKKAIDVAEKEGLGAEFVTQDIRQFAPQTRSEVVTAFGVLNHMATLRELEGVFRMVYHALDSKRIFVFDLRTIQSLAQAHMGDEVVSDLEDKHLILARRTFGYETLTLTEQYTIFRFEHTGAWVRHEETHLLRGYPLQGVTRLLTQCRFKVLRLLTSQFEPYESHKDPTHVLVAAQRED